MGQNGEIAFFTERFHRPPQELAREALELAGAQSVLSVWRSIGEDREWDHILNTFSDDDVDTELAGSKLSCDAAAQLYRDGTSLRFLLGEASLAARMWDAIRDAIPESVRGSFAPGDPSIVVGWHDLWENAEHDNGFLFGRAAFSFGLFGYGTPNDWPRFRAMIFDVPAVIDLQQRVEAIAGPVKRCVHWSV